MKKKNRLAILAAATVMSGVLGIGSANAIIISGSYSITELYSDATNSTGGGPVITGQLGTNLAEFSVGGLNHAATNTSTGTGNTFSFSLTPGAAYTAPINLATFNPDATCQGPGCSGFNINPALAYIETDPITISFTFTSPTGAGTVTDTANFVAKYNYPYLACDPGGDGSGKSDCVTWAVQPLVANFADGSHLNIMLNNAADWAITPTIQFQLVNGPGGGGGQQSVPEPGSLLLLSSALGSALVGLGFFGRRRKDAAA